MTIRILILLYILSSPLLFAHSNKKKQSLKSHEHGVGVLNIAQEDKIKTEFDLLNII